MKLWVGEKLMFSYPIVLLFCIYFYALEMGVVRGVYSDAAGLWWENRYRAIAESIANLVLNFIFIKFWGVFGVIIATLISLLVINFGFGSQIVFKHYFKNKKLKEYFLNHSKYVLVTLVIGTVTFGINYFIPINGVAGLIVKFLVCCVVPNILYILIYYRTKMYKIAMPWILSVFHLQNKLKFLYKG
jgi:O-antigen/teichoic acid export membrane protein